MVVTLFFSLLESIFCCLYWLFSLNPYNCQNNLFYILCFLMTLNTNAGNTSDVAVTNESKSYFDPWSNLLGCYEEDVLTNPLYMWKWIDFLCKKKEACIAKWEKSFIEHISTHAQARSISSLNSLSDWDKDLISKLESEWFIVIFHESKTKSIPSTTSIYVELFR